MDVVCFLRHRACSPQQPWMFSRAVSECRSPCKQDSRGSCNSPNPCTLNCKTRLRQEGASRNRREVRGRPAGRKSTASRRVESPSAEGRPAGAGWSKSFRNRRAWTSLNKESTYRTANMTIMEAPYTIASLPKPLDAEHGSIYASPVFSYRGLKKRKRHEVVVGVDGESLNIYNVCLRQSSAMDLTLTHTRSSPSLSLLHTLFLHNRISAAHLAPSTSDETATLLPRDTHTPRSRTRAHNSSAGSCDSSSA